MVAGQHPQPVAPQKIGAAVARPGQARHRPVDDQRDDRRSHLAVSSLARLEAHQTICLGKPADQRRVRILVIADGFQTVDHNVRGDIAVAVTTHTIGHRPKAPRRVGQDRILIAFAQPAAMGQPRSAHVRHRKKLFRNNRRDPGHAALAPKSARRRVGMVDLLQRAMPGSNRHAVN